MCPLSKRSAWAKSQQEHSKKKKKDSSHKANEGKYWFLYYPRWLNKTIDNALIQELCCNNLKAQNRNAAHAPYNQGEISLISNTYWMIAQCGARGFLCCWVSNLLFHLEPCLCREEGQEAAPKLQRYSPSSCSQDWALHTVSHCERLRTDLKRTLPHCNGPFFVRFVNIMLISPPGHTGGTSFVRVHAWKLCIINLSPLLQKASSCCLCRTNTSSHNESVSNFPMTALNLPFHGEPDTHCCRRPDFWTSGCKYRFHLKGEHFTETC